MDVSLIRTYRLYQKIMAYPELASEIRGIFLTALDAKGIVTLDAIEAEAREKLQAAGMELSPENVDAFRDALIDLYFASHFAEAELDNYINLARKHRARVE